MRNARLSVALTVLLAGWLAAGAQSTAPSAQANPSDRAVGPVQPKTPNGGVEILSDTQGIDFEPYLARWHSITEKTWQSIMPKEVNKPLLLKGVDVIRFKLLPTGRVTDMKLEGRSGTESLDRAAWGAITGSSYPPLPRDFHGPYLELRAYFLYNERPQ